MPSFFASCILLLSVTSFVLARPVLTEETLSGKQPGASRFPDTPKSSWKNGQTHHVSSPFPVEEGATDQKSDFATNWLFDEHDKFLSTLTPVKIGKNHHGHAEDGVALDVDGSEADWDWGRLIPKYDSDDESGGAEPDCGSSNKSLLDCAGSNLPSLEPEI